jgi:LuxR family maltose regulon positive regulatory protein
LLVVLRDRDLDRERLALADGSVSKIPLSDGSATIEPWVLTLRAHMMPNGVEQALADADRALEQLPPDSFWVSTALLGRAGAHALLGTNDRAVVDFEAAIDRGLATGSVEEVYAAQARLALLAANKGAWGEAGRRARAAESLVEESGLGDYASSALPHVATARVALHDGRQEDAGAALARAHRLRPMLDHGLPSVTIQVGLELARAHLALADPGAARTVLGETERVLELRPHMGALVEDVKELHDHVAATEGPAGAWAMSLTAAEIRLLPYLATHLTFPEIGDRLFITRNTVKTEAVSIYRKLTASSRSEAIERAVEVGLLEASVVPPRSNLIPEG